MMAFVLGAAAGYVLGARAGRERYEQIVHAYHRISEHPAVQSAAGVARQKVVGAVYSKMPHRNGKVDHSTSVSTTPTSTPQVTTIPRS